MNKTVTLRLTIAEARALSDLAGEGQQEIEEILLTKRAADAGQRALDKLNAAIGSGGFGVVPPGKTEEAK